jgi:hypothetical protein
MKQREMQERKDLHNPEQFNVFREDHDRRTALSKDELHDPSLPHHKPRPNDARERGTAERNPIADIQKAPRALQANDHLDQVLM